jgi:hypothetical protein
MKRIAEYGIGCGVMLLVAGIIFAVALYFGWGGSSKAIFQVVLLLGEVLGSQYLAAGLISVIGLVLLLFGLGIRDIQNAKQK